MNNTGRIIRAKSDNSFTKISNKILQDCSMSFEEKGLLAYLLSLPEDWVLYKSTLHEKTNESKGTVDRVFKLLQNRGYIVSIRVVNPETKVFQGWNHEVCEEPKVDESRLRQNPISDNADIAQTTPIQIHSITNTEYNKETLKKENIKRKKAANEFVPPTVDEVKQYFLEKGYSPSKGEQAFNYYNSNDWKDKNNKQVMNWKMKMQLWFKPEDKIDVSKLKFEVENPEQYEGFNKYRHYNEDVLKELVDGIWHYRTRPIGFKKG